MKANELLEAALQYQRMGWSVIPLQPKSKHPIFAWGEFQNRRATEEEVRRWWTIYPAANVGIVTGKISGIIVLDIDGLDGERAMEGKTLAATPTSNTGKGLHFIFQHPGGEIRNFARRLPGTDLRGDGGYIVAPPSIHPDSGKPYEWAISPEMEAPGQPPGWLMELIWAKEGKGQSGGVEPLEVIQGIAEGQRDNLLYKYACRLRLLKVRREEAEVLVLEAARNCKPPFPAREALVKVEQAWKFAEGNDTEQAVSEIAENAEDIFAEKTLRQLALFKKDKPWAYAKVKQKLKGKVNLNDLEKAVNKQMEENRKVKAEAAAESASLADLFPDLPLKSLRRPCHWMLGLRGIWTETKSGPVCACSVPVILAKRLQNVDTAQEKIELAFYRDGCWHYIIADRSIVFNRLSIVQLTNRGLPVSSENARFLVKYLDDLERENLQELPIVKSASHMGWVGKNFLPGNAGEIVMDTGDDGTNSVVSGYREKGELEAWKSVVGPVRDYYLARFMLAASFAAPLLELVGQRVFIVHVWGASRGGKTAAAKAALSVWGEPEVLMANFNATKVGLERLAAFYADLPLVIDEKQVIGDRQGFIENLVYLLSLGKGKARGSKGGGLQAFNTWRTVCITTGEEPLATSSSRAGISTRAIELYGLPIGNENLAGRLHEATREQFGTAGIAFIQRLCEMLKQDSDLLKSQFEDIKACLQARAGDKAKSHLAAIATVMLADFYASMWIFGLDEADAFYEAQEMARKIIGQLESAEELDDAKRAHEYFMDWYRVNEECFKDYAPAGKKYGMLQHGDIYVFPLVFEKAMQEGGFNPARILRDWADRNYIETETKGGKRRFKVGRKSGGMEFYYYCVKLMR